MRATGLFRPAAMRGLSRVALLTLASAVVVLPLAARQKDPPPAGCHWQEIQVLKARLAVPDGWQFKDTSTGLILSYEVRPAGPGLENAKARYRLEVRRGLRRAEVADKAKEFVESVRAGATEAQALDREEVGVMTLFSSVVTNAPPGPGAGPVSTAVSAAANTKTGTLYTARLDIPADEVDRLADPGNRLFQNMRLDDDI